MIEAVIFDMDGVLIDSEPLHFEAVKSVLNSYHITIDDHYLDQFTGDTNEHIWEIIIKDFKLENTPEIYINQQLDTTIDCLKKGDYKPIDGITDLLQSLQNAPLPIGIASSSPPKIIESIIEKLEIEKYIDIWVSGNEVTKSKPEPYIYLEVAKRLQVNPANCIAIEDSEYGVTAAKAAGMQCIAYNNSSSGKQQLQQADVVVEKIKDISLGMMEKLMR